MELDITAFAQSQNMNSYSNSIANSGLSNIGDITWSNAQSLAKEWPNVSRDVLIPYFAEYGAWDDLEVWSDIELNAVLVQMIAGDLAEYQAYASPAAYEQASTDGKVSGNIYTTDTGALFYNINF